MVGSSLKLNGVFLNVKVYSILTYLVLIYLISSLVFSACVFLYVFHYVVYLGRGFNPLLTAFVGLGVVATHFAYVGFKSLVRGWS